MEFGHMVISNDLRRCAVIIIDGPILPNQEYLQTLSILLRIQYNEHVRSHNNHIDTYIVQPFFRTVQMGEMCFESLNLVRKHRRHEFAVNIRCVMIRFQIFICPDLSYYTVKTSVYAFIIGIYLATNGVCNVTVFELST